jgi:hypothetical protein
MKHGTRVAAVLLLGLAPWARADFSQTFNFNQVPGGVAIPDGSLVGVAFNGNVTGMPTGPITDVNVRLNLSGGWNGDLYAYLVHDSQPGFAVLLNRVGRTASSGAGSSAAGMDVWLSDQAASDIHNVAAPGFVPNTYKPDGRTTSPLLTVDTSSRTPNPLASFNGGNANGNWTLFLADVSGGDVSTLNSWSLEIAAVPEPASLIEGSVAVLFLGGIVWLYRRKAAKQQAV